MGGQWVGGIPVDDESSGAAADLSPEIDTSVTHPARRYDYWLGGVDNFAVDRESGDAIAAVFPSIRMAVQENRRFLGRAVGFLAREAGIDQFLDIGTGLPSAGNTHEVARRFNPSARVVYVDNDPLVLAHARALLAGAAPDGAIAYITADLRDPDSILAAPALCATLDLSRPVALMLIAVLHFLDEKDEPYAKVHRLLDALPTGSYLVISHGTFDFMSPEEAAEARSIDLLIRPRGRNEIARFFAGHDLLPPGLVSTSRWRAEHEPWPRPAEEDVAMYGGMAVIGGTGT